MMAGMSQWREMEEDREVREMLTGEPGRVGGGTVCVCVCVCVYVCVCVCVCAYAHVHGVRETEDNECPDYHWLLQAMCTKALHHSAPQPPPALTTKQCPVLHGITGLPNALRGLSPHPQGVRGIRVQPRDVCPELTSLGGQGPVAMETEAVLDQEVQYSRLSTGNR